MHKLILLLSLVGCSDPSIHWVAGFNPPALQSGFTRYVTATIKNIKPGADDEWCQWVAGPDSEPRDVLAIGGAQSNTGHHAVVYSTSEINFPVGESHRCTEDDMLSISFLGAIGGEG